ncbi:MAG: hypothetical protein ACP5G2_07215 [Candidatus Bipolaricaulaceae bacterium]
MKRLGVALACALLVGAGGAAQEQGCAVSGSLGVEFTFLPVPPATLEVDTAVTLALSFAGAEVVSRSELSATGLEAQHLSFGVELDGVSLETGMRFDPCFSLYRFQARGGCCPFDLGAIFLVENLAAACQTPDYTVGIVLDLGLVFDEGFFMRSITGFGVEELYALVDDDPDTQLVAVPGWWFEEELMQLGFCTQCFRSQSIFLFDELGFSWARFEVAYLWPDPAIELGAGVWIDSSFAFAQADLTLGFTVDPIQLRSVTTFSFAGFLAQEIHVGVAFSGVRLYSETRFDFSGMLEEVVGFELSF